MTPLELLRKDGSELFIEAQSIAKKRKSLFATGLQINTICRIHPPCRHCLWFTRERYTPNFRRKVPLDQIVKQAKEAKRQEIDRIYLASGWMGKDLSDDVYEAVIAIKEQVDIDLYGMFGTINQRSLLRLQKAGIDGYRCSLESPNPDLFNYLKPGDSLDNRIETLKSAKEIGLPIWSEFIIGVGENDQDIVNGIEMLKKLEVNTFLFVPFRPVPFIEMEERSGPNPYQMAKVMAAARIFIPDADMFAVYNNMEWGYRAGCNGAFVSTYPNNVTRFREMREMLNESYPGKTG
ncbi:radical SAM protein [bacterium]|nr:radical SAM protein [bacterium]